MRLSSTAIVLRLGYIGVLAIATLSDLELNADVAGAVSRLDRALRPQYGLSDVIDAVRNVALFAGWGALWVASTSAAGLRWAIRRVGITGASLSLILESVQLFSPTRTASFLDLGTNTGGALAGAAIILGLIKSVAAFRRKKSYLGLPTFVLAAGYCGAIALEAIVPSTRSQTIPDVYGGPVARFRSAFDVLDTSVSGGVPWVDFFLFFPLGILGVAALVEFRMPRRVAAIVMTLIGSVGALAAELVRGFAALPIQFNVAILHAVAVATGAMIAAVGLGPFSKKFRGRRRPLVVTVSYMAVLAAWAWHPFGIQTDLELIAAQFDLARLIPLQAQAWRTDLFSVADVGRAFCLYFPLGALLAVWPVRRYGPLRAAIPGVMLVVLLELSQGLLIDRFVDGTDMLVGTAGLLIGWRAMRLAGLEPHGSLVVPRGAQSVQYSS